MRVTTRPATSPRTPLRGRFGALRADARPFASSARGSRAGRPFEKDDSKGDGWQVQGKDPWAVYQMSGKWARQEEVAQHHMRHGAHEAAEEHAEHDGVEVDALRGPMGRDLEEQSGGSVRHASLHQEGQARSTFFVSSALYLFQSSRLRRCFSGFERGYLPRNS